MRGSTMTKGKVGNLEAVLATYLTDGHYNGIAIGVRNLDPMIFKHLIDKHLIKTVFPVRGSGETWCLGAYFDTDTSRRGLQALTNSKKPYAQIRPEILSELDIDGAFQWIVEYEASAYISRWGRQPLINFNVQQYEDLHLPQQVWSQWGQRDRVRLSISKTRELMINNVVRPSRLWTNQLMDEYARRGKWQNLFHFYKSYQIDALPKRHKASLTHSHYLLCNPITQRKYLTSLKELTLSHTWKRTCVSLECEAMEKYLEAEITWGDLELIKGLLAGGSVHRSKGPYSEYVRGKLQEIEEHINGVGAAKLMHLKSYLQRRKKSFKNFMKELAKDEKQRLIELAERMNSLGDLIELLGAAQDNNTQFNDTQLVGDSCSP